MRAKFQFKKSKTRVRVKVTQVQADDRTRCRHCALLTRFSRWVYVLPSSPFLAPTTAVCAHFIKLFSTTVNFGPLKKNDLDIWPWNSIGFVRLSRCMFMQSIIKLSAAVHELSWVLAQRKKLRQKQYSPSLPRGQKQRCRINLAIFCGISFNDDCDFCAC